MAVECNEEVADVNGVKIFLRFTAPTGQIEAGNTKSRVDAAKMAVTRGLQLFAAEKQVKVQKQQAGKKSSGLILPR